MSCHQQITSGSKFSQAMVQQTPQYDRRPKPRKKRKAKRGKRGLYD